MRNTLDAVQRFSMQGMRLLPTNLISRLMGHVSRRPASRRLVRPFARAFRVDLAEAELPIGDYPTLNAFFTRRLKPGLRPFDPQPSVLVSPVDGWVSTSGACAEDRLLQVKGIEYSLFGLLRDGPMSRLFERGQYATLYLSPQDYHRVHAPLDLEVTGIGYMPGTLLPVNRPAVRFVDQLYTVNERVAVYARSPLGEVAVVLVGAHCVGSIRLSFHPFVSNRPGVGPTRIGFETPIRVPKGEELGAFELGSTVVMLFEPGRLQACLPAEGESVRLGQTLGRALPAPART